MHLYIVYFALFLTFLFLCIFQLLIHFYNSNTAYVYLAACKQLLMCIHIDTN